MYAGVDTSLLASSTHNSSTFFSSMLAPKLCRRGTNNELQICLQQNSPLLLQLPPGMANLLHFLGFPGSGTPLCCRVPSKKRDERGERRKSARPANFDFFKLHLGSDNWSNAAQCLGLASTMELLQYSRNLVTGRNKLPIFENKQFTSASTDMSAPSYPKVERFLAAPKPPGKTTPSACSQGWQTEVGFNRLLL